MLQWPTQPRWLTCKNNNNRKKRTPIEEWDAVPKPPVWLPAWAAAALPLQLRLVLPPATEWSENMLLPIYLVCFMRWDCWTTRSPIVPNNTKQRSKHPLENSLNCFCWQGLLAHYPRDLAHSSDMLVIPHTPGLCKWDIFTEENKQLPMTSDSVLSTKWQRWSIEWKGPFFFCIWQVYNLIFRNNIQHPFPFQPLTES